MYINEIFIYLSWDYKIGWSLGKKFGSFLYSIYEDHTTPIHSGMFKKKK